MASLPTYFDIALVNQGDKSDGVPAFCIGYDDGLLDVNLLTQKQCTAGENELRTLENMVRENADALLLVNTTKSIHQAIGETNGTEATVKDGKKAAKGKAR